MTVRSAQLLSGVITSAAVSQLTVPVGRTVIIKHLAATNQTGTGSRIKSDIFYSGESPHRRWLDQTIAVNGNLLLDLWVVVLEEETIEVSTPAASPGFHFVLSGTILQGVAPW